MCMGDARRCNVHPDLRPKRGGDAAECCLIRYVTYGLQLGGLAGGAAPSLWFPHVTVVVCVETFLGFSKGVPWEAGFDYVSSL